VTSSFDNQYHQEKIGENINIHKLPIGKNKKNLHFQSKKDLLVYSWKAYWFSKKLIKNKKYDLTHSFFSVPCGFISLLIRMKHKIPYVVSLRGADVPGYSERFSSIYNMLTPLIKFIWKKSEAVVSNSAGLRDLAQKTNSNQKIEVIYNGVDTDEFRPQDNVSHSSSSYILCISRLTERKGINYLISAIKDVSVKYPNIKLKIVGEGNAKNDLEKQAKDLGMENKVEFLGLVPHEKLPNIYSSALFFVLPSLNEGMSNTMLEALASGLPIVATDTGGTRELVEDGQNGLIIKMKDSGDISEKMEKLLKNKNLRERMALSSRKKAERLSWQSVAEKYYGLYKNTALGR